MRILIDTNVIISAALSSNSAPYQAFVKAVTAPNKGCICTQNEEECRRIFAEKFPNRLDDLNDFLERILTMLDKIPIPSRDFDQGLQIRDVSDLPILRSAMAANIDIILTGDKDFLEAGIDNPKCLTPAEFLLFNCEPNQGSNQRSENKV